MPQRQSNSLFHTPNVYSWGGGLHLLPDGGTLAFVWNSSGH